MEHKIKLRRELGKAVGKPVLMKSLERIVGIALRGQRGHGWKHTIMLAKSQRHPDHLVYEALVSMVRRGGREDVCKRQIKAIEKRIWKAGHSAQFGSRPWVIVGYKPDDTESQKPRDQEKDYGSITLNGTGVYDGIYGREAHIQRLQSAVDLAIRTKLQKRYHVLLYGPPGCGKTDMLQRFVSGLGQEGRAYLMIDATCTTQAGILKKLIDAPVIPPIMVIEEIEKADENSLRWLLGVLDQRGQIRQVNWRVGTQYRNVRMLVLATANDIRQFRRVMSGALASRFSHQLYCPRPNKDVMRLILRREVKSIQGNEKWIEPAIDFCYDVLKMDDPREIIPICLCGGDRLLDGSYQQTIQATMEPKC